MRIDGIHYEREPNVEELRNIRGHLMERHARILADIALVNAAIDRKTQDILPFDTEHAVGHALIEGQITAEEAFGIGG